MKLTLGVLNRIFEDCGIKTVQELGDSMQEMHPKTLISVLFRTQEQEGVTREEVENIDDLGDAITRVTHLFEEFFGGSGEGSEGDESIPLASVTSNDSD